MPQTSYTIALSPPEKGGKKRHIKTKTYYVSKTAVSICKKSLHPLWKAVEQNYHIEFMWIQHTAYVSTTKNPTVRLHYIIKNISPNTVKYFKKCSYPQF